MWQEARCQAMRRHSSAPISGHQPPSPGRRPCPGSQDSADSPHSSLGSSEPSPQSSSPSHFQRAGMQRPESLQRNSSTPQVIWAARGWARW